MIRTCVLALALAACRRDVQLGVATDAAVDVMADGNGNPFTAGTYALAFVDPAQQNCDGSLLGMEGAFGSITRASLGLVDGAVVISTPTATTLELTGAPITSAFGQPTLELVPSSGSAPPGFWDGLVSGDFSTGPLTTTRTATDLASDSTTATAATIEAQLAVLYTTLDSNGACTVAFGVTFTHP